MRLLFKENVEGTKEIKNLLGFIDADLKVTNMRSEITTATEEIIEEVGANVYSYAERCYYDEPLSELDPESEQQTNETLDDDFLYRIRYAIILRAYAAFAPLNDLSHTNQGRLMRSDEHQKSPFEWQVVRSDLQLEKKFYQALDSLLRYLDSTNTANWKESSHYKLQQQLLVSSLTDFRNIYEIDSRYLYKKLIPGLLQAQEHEVKPRVGLDIFTELLKFNQGEQEITSIDPVTLRYAREIMVYHAMAWGLERFNVTLLPDRVVQQFFSERSNIRASTPPPALQAEAAAQKFREDRDVAIASLEKHLEPPKTMEDSDTTPIINFLFNKDDMFVG